MRMSACALCWLWPVWARLTLTPHNASAVSNHLQTVRDSLHHKLQVSSCLPDFHLFWTQEPVSCFLSTLQSPDTQTLWSLKSQQTSFTGKFWFTVWSVRATLPSLACMSVLHRQAETSHLDQSHSQWCALVLSALPMGGVLHFHCFPGTDSQHN